MFLSSRWLVIAGGIYASSVSAVAQAPTQFTGKLAPQLAEVASGVSPVVFKTATEADLGLLAAPLATGERAFRGNITYYTQKDGERTVARRIPLLLVEGADSAQALYVALDTGAKLSASARRPLVNREPGSIAYRDGDQEVQFGIPLPAGQYWKEYPYRYLRSASRTEGYVKAIRANPDSVRILWQTSVAAQGTLAIGDRQVLVQYDVDPHTGRVRDIGYYGVDANGDGTIAAQDAAERTYRRSATDNLVFRVGDAYVTPASVDAVTGAIAFQQRKASDYQFLELAVGKEIPDVDFVQLSGESRKLSDFHGKYVLVTFWGTWCGACRGEIPYLKEAYAKYKDRGFEIVGFGYDDDIEEVRAFLAKQNMTWPQTSTALPEHGKQVAAFMRDRMRITAFPTVLLLDPQGVVVSLNGTGEPGLRGKGLLETLETLLPPSTASR